MTLSGANRHDSMALAATLDAIPSVRSGKRGRPRHRPAKLHADKAYDHRRCRRECRQRGIKPCIARREIESSQKLGRPCWMVERTLAWLGRFRRLTVRYERRADIHLALITLGCALVCLNQVKRFCWALLEASRSCIKQWKTVCCGVANVHAVKTMISFAAEIPVAASSSVDAFVECVRVWVQGMPRSKIDSDNLQAFGSEVHVVRSNKEKLELVMIPEKCAIRYTLKENGIEWRTDLTFCSVDNAKFASVRTYREADQSASHLPDAKTPIIVRVLLERLGAGPDGDLVLSSKPLSIGLGNVNFVANALWGASGNRLPVVYSSIPFHGSTIDGVSLAGRLHGRAHVWIEEDRQVSRALQTAMDGRNVYGGVVGIYWPDDARHQTFYTQSYHNLAELEDEVVCTVRDAWLNRKQMRGTSWEDISLEGVIVALDAERRRVAEEYVEVFDNEVGLLKHRLAVVEAEARELKAKLQASTNSQIAADAEILELRNKIKGSVKNALSSRQNIKLETGEFAEAFSGEILEIVLDALRDAQARYVAESRRQHALQSVCDSNKQTRVLDERRSELKRALSQYTSMDHRTRSALKELGFELDESGKHIKATYLGDSRYVFTLAKTGSDYRGGMNSVSEIGKRLF